MNPAIERFAAAFDAQDVDAIMAAMTPDCVFEDTAPARRQRGTSAPRRCGRRGRRSSPPQPAGVFTTEEVIDAGERVVTRWRYDFDGGHVRGVDVFRVRDGLVAEKFSYVKG